MAAADTRSLPCTSTTSTKRDKKNTAVRDRASPSRKAYRRRNRARNQGRPRRSSRTRVQPARPASSSSRGTPVIRTVSRTPSSPSHSTPQKVTPFRAHRFSSRSGKGPSARRVTVPRRRFVQVAMPPPYSRLTQAIRPRISSSAPVMAFRSSPSPRTRTTMAPALTQISSVP